MINWENLPGVFIKIRNSSYFDSYLIEGGPPPLRMKDGNYFYIYNSARCCFPSEKPGYHLQYNPGFVILDGNDPTKILQRSNAPIMSPQLDWEKGTPPFLHLTPNVIFVEGMKYENLNLKKSKNKTKRNKRKRGIRGRDKRGIKGSDKRDITGDRGDDNDYDSFIIYYGAADSVVGVARVKVKNSI